jgi:hypothetical protein
MVVRKYTLQETHHISEKVEETTSLTSEIAISELVTENNNASPEKLRELDPFLVSANESPSGMHTRCVWSPLASPSTSILKRGLKRPQEDEVSSPINKVGLRLNVNESNIWLEYSAIQWHMISDKVLELHVHSLFYHGCYGKGQKEEKEIEVP